MFHPIKLFLRTLVKLDSTGFLTFLALELSSIKKEHEAWLRPFFGGKHDTIIDVGASIGMHTLHFAKMAKKVVAIEPEKRSFRALSFRTRNYRNVVPLKLVISDKNSMLKLYTSDHPLHHSLLGNHSDKIEMVLSMTLDELANKLKLTDITLIKIDTEGAEHLVIEGAEKVLSEQKPRLVIEYHGNMDVVTGKLKSYGYVQETIRVGAGVGVKEHGWIRAYAI